MNIFVVHSDPCVAAEQLCDAHVCKMGLEGVQILCTAHELQRRAKIAGLVKKMMTGPSNNLRYDHLEFSRERIEQLKSYPAMPMKPVRSLEHRQHPVILWVQADPGNLHWFLRHTRAVFKEYEFRFHRVHDAFYKFEEALHIKRTSFSWCFGSARQHVAPNHKYDKMYARLHFCQAMPEEYRCSPNTMLRTVRAYRRFYVEDKVKFARWTNGRPPPDWWPFSTSRPPHGRLESCPFAKVEPTASVSL